MRLRPGSPRFAKELPGADCRYAPAELPGYAGTPWDVRISLGDAPLEEAFYFTIEGDGPLQLPLAELLEAHVLNPGRRGELDVATYPELPFLQEELGGYWEAAREGRLLLEIHVNHRPGSHPLRWDQPAVEHLGICTFHDGSWDYRVLDLVWLLEAPEPEAGERERLWSIYAPLVLLARLGEGDWSLPGGGVAQRWPRLQGVLGGLAARGLVEGDPGQGLGLTAPGAREWQRLQEEAAELTRRYEGFASVSLHPPALGVPNGFDVRLQMMEQDGVDPERGIFLLSLFGEEGALLWEDPHWVEALEEGSLLVHIHAALAFRTAFTPQVLDPLRPLAAG